MTISLLSRIRRSRGDPELVLATWMHLVTRLGGALVRATAARHSSLAWSNMGKYCTIEPDIGGSVHGKVYGKIPSIKTLEARERVNILYASFEAMSYP
jgi:hypothetical protein